jgi:diacylglycerol kinase (ATP)
LNDFFYGSIYAIMLFKKVHVIINLANQKDDSIVTDLAAAFKKTSFEFGYTIILRNDDTNHIVKELLGKVDLIAVYGGDGTVTRVAHAMIGQKVPLAILPCGTANVIAKEFCIPLELEEAIELITNDLFEIKTIDTGLCNRKPFIIRVNFGLMADMVSHTHRAMKDTFGQLAYGLSAVDALADVVPTKYKMHMDGYKVTETGVSLSVTNIGSIGIADYSILPAIKIDDGFFDVILLNHADILSLLRIAGSTLLQTESSVLKRWRCKEIKIDLKRSQSYILDDCELKGRQFNISIVPKSLRILVPKQKENSNDFIES